MQIGIIGLGKMGSSIALQCREKGVEVVGLSKETPQGPELRSAGVTVVSKVGELVRIIPGPRIIFLYVPAGPAVDAVIDSLIPLLSRDDVLVDAGNSHFRDSQARAKRLEAQGIGFIDCGSSGGPAGARTGACFMVGGKKSDVLRVQAVFRALAVEDGFIHAGPSGAGHFVKLIHNAIEFGMLQAIGEGVALLSASEFKLDLPALFHNWSHGSVIRGWLVELMEQQLRQHPDFDKVPSYVEDTGEVNWAVEEALKLEVAVPVITAAINELFSSRDEHALAHKSVALLRHGFGGHPFGRSSAIALERRTGKVRSG